MEQLLEEWKMTSLSWIVIYSLINISHIANTNDNKMTTTAIILAGGLGTRLRSIVAHLPKPMANVAGKPFLHYVLTQLQHAGITHVILSVGYKWETIRDYFGDAFENITLNYCVEEVPLGTGGAIKAAMQLCTSEKVLVLNGDSIFNFELKQFVNYNTTAPVLMAARIIDDASRYGTLTIDAKNVVTNFIEKTNLAQQGTINTGIYLIHKTSFLNDCPTQNKFSIEQDYFAHIVQRQKIQAYTAQGYFIDIGIPEDYTRAQYEFNTLTFR
jgi:D-glycero-alpha-D-manno-heptose 1-phosphate guanylyltransferase